MESQVVRTLFRIVSSNPPTVLDFWSHQRRGKPLLNPKMKDIFDGVSTYDSFEAARAKATTYPDIGRWIAQLRVVEQRGVVRIERTGSRRERHFTIWADPELLLACVVNVRPGSAKAQTK